MTRPEVALFVAALAFAGYSVVLRVRLAAARESIADLARAGEEHKAAARQWYDRLADVHRQYVELESENRRLVLRVDAMTRPPDPPAV